MTITQEQLDSWKHLPEPIPDLINEIQRQRDLLRFIWWASTTCSQTALGPLQEVREKILHEITEATRGTLPKWFDPASPEWK